MPRPYGSQHHNQDFARQPPPALLRVLVVDDDPADLRLISRITSTAGYEVRQARNGQEAVGRVLDDCPDLVVTDWDMPGLDGVQLCQQLRTLDVPFYVYVLLLTAKSRPQELVQALEAGADDFISKPISPAVLLARLKAGARTVVMERSLRRLSQSDPLTGALNRRAFYERLTSEWDKAARDGKPLSCVMIDLDFFKRLNDSFGHVAGDTMLQAVVHLFQSACGPLDAVARLGGEEFCVLLVDADETTATRWAESMVSALAQQRVPFHDQVLTASASFGVATRMPDMTAPEALVQQADQALSIAKESGRSRVVAFRRLTTAAPDGTPAAAVPDPWEQVLARDVMAPALYTPHQDDTVAQVADLFLQLRIDAAPVVDGAGRLVGVVSEGDLLSAATAHRLLDVPIRHCMKTIVVQYSEDVPAIDVYRFLSRAAVPRVIVVRQGQPTGVISRSTLLRWLRNWVMLRPRSADGDVLSISARAAGILRAADAASDRLLALRQEVAAAGCDLVPCAVAEASRLEEIICDMLAHCRGRDHL